MVPGAGQPARHFNSQDECPVLEAAIRKRLKRFLTTGIRCFSVFFLTDSPQNEGTLLFSCPSAKASMLRRQRPRAFSLSENTCAIIWGVCVSVAVPVYLDVCNSLRSRGCWRMLFAPRNPDALGICVPMGTGTSISISSMDPHPLPLPPQLLRQRIAPAVLRCVLNSLHS